MRGDAVNCEEGLGVTPELHQGAGVFVRVGFGVGQTGEPHRSPIGAMRSQPSALDLPCRVHMFASLRCRGANRLSLC